MLVNNSNDIIFLSQQKIKYYIIIDIKSTNFISCSIVLKGIFPGFKNIFISRRSTIMFDLSNYFSQLWLETYGEKIYFFSSYSHLKMIRERKKKIRKKTAQNSSPFCPRRRRVSVHYIICTSFMPIWYLFIFQSCNKSED